MPERTGKAGRRRGEAASGSGPARVAPPPDGDPAPRRAADVDRIAELEAELAAAHRTIDVLLDKAERRAATLSTQAELFEAAARMEQLIEQRTRELEEQRTALEAANSELRALTSNLDQIVKQRTRALAESEAQLRLKNAELERQTAAKAEFISIVAHELRTPLTSIVGYLDLLAEGRFGDLPDGVLRPLASLRRNAHRLKRLVDEMLDVSRIESGKVVLRRLSIELGQLVRDVVTELAPLAEAKTQTVVLDVGELRPIAADADKIHQVVVNLVSNAIRYTPEGGTVALTVDAAPQDRFPGDWVRMRVRDNGIGIAAAHRDLIFEPFSDVQPAKHHTSSGPDSAGLGLYIARGLIELHGGLITVESEEGVFTEFTVFLPAAPPAGQAAPGGTPPRRVVIDEP
jgi:signal transduction histidine kinase